MENKKWQSPIGARGAKGVDSVAELVRRNIMERDEKKMKRDDEIESLEHRAKIKDLTAPAPQEKEPLVQIEPIKFDIQAGEKAASERATKAEEDAAQERNRRGELQNELGKERLERLESGFNTQVGELKKALDEKKDEKTITEKLSEIKETAATLGWGPQQVSNQVPADIQLQMRKMDSDLQLRLAEMEDNRSHRDKEWQLTIKQWDDERQLKQQELAQKAASDAERTQLMRSGLGTMGKVIGQSFMENGGVSAQPKNFSIEAGVGEEGEVTCPGCSASMFLPPDANDLVCPSCGSVGKVVRKAVAATSKKVGK